VYEFVPHAHLRAGSDTLTFFEIADLIGKVALALGKMHSQGFIHHDVKPNNIFVNPKNEEVTLFDYNCVCRPYFLTEGIETHNTVPPEYKRGNSPINQTFDVYQLGEIFYRMTHTFNIKDGKITPCPRIKLPEGTLEIIAKTTSDNMAQRPNNCTDFYEMLSKLKK